MAVNLNLPKADRPAQEAGGWSRIGWLTVFYGLLSLGLTYPVVRHLATAVAGFDGRDSLQHVWYQWWMKETFLELGIWPDQVIHLYYPLGADHPVLALHPFVPLTFLPVTLLFGPLISYNVAFLAGFTLSGLAGYLLCRYVCRHSGAAIVGGLIFAFYPNRVGHAAAGHLLLTTTYFLPLYALSLLILLRRPSAKRAVWHGVVTGLLALAQPTHIGYGLIPLFLVLTGSWLVRRGLGYRLSGSFSPSLSRSLTWVGVAVGLALIIYLPFAWPTLSQDQQNGLTYLTPSNLTDHSTDLLAFLLPSPYNPLLAEVGFIPPFKDTIIDGFRDLEEQLAYPGFIAFGLAILALAGRSRISLPWAVLTLGSALLSLGPFLKIAGEVQAVTLPYIWLTRLPFFAWSRTPGRLNGTMMLGIAVLASIGAAWLFEKLTQAGKARSSTGGSATLNRDKKIVATDFTDLPGNKGKICENLCNPWQILTRGLTAFAIHSSRQSYRSGTPWWLFIPLGGLILVEYLVIFPFPVEMRPISNYYYHLAGQPVTGGILELPVTGSRRASNYAMYYQTVHEHPLAGGYIERDPPGTVALKEFLNQLVSPLAGQTVLELPNEQQRKAILADMGIEQVIAQPNLMTDRAARARQEYLPLLLGQTVFEDEETAVYPVPAPDSQSVDRHLLPDQENWELLQEGRILRLKKEGYLFIYTAEAGSVRLEFQVDTLPETTKLSLAFNDSVTDQHLLESAANYTSDPLLLRPGLNYLRLSTEPARDIDLLKISIKPTGD